MRSFVTSFFRRIGTDNISFLAGGVAFYGLLAVFPAMAALVAVFGLFARTRVLHDELEQARALFPPDVFAILSDQLTALTATSGNTLSLTAVISMLIALFSATRGTKAMLAALNIIFRTTENRPWWLRQGLALFLTLGGLLTLVLAVFIIIAVPLVLTVLPDDLVTLIRGPLATIRWAILAGAIMTGIFILFAFGPNRPPRTARLVGLVAGSGTATALWILGALGGSWFVQHVPHLHAAYGSLSAVIVLMLWMLMSAYAVLAGAGVAATFDDEK